MAAGKEKTIKTAPRRSIDTGPPSQGCDIVLPSIGRCNAKIPPGTGYIDHRPSFIAPGSGRAMRAPTMCAFGDGAFDVDPVGADVGIGPYGVRTAMVHPTRQLGTAGHLGRPDGCLQFRAAL